LDPIELAGPKIVGSYSTIMGNMADIGMYKAPEIVMDDSGA